MGIIYSEYVVAKYNADDTLVYSRVGKSLRSFTQNPALARRYRFAHHAKDRCDFLNRYYEKYTSISKDEKYCVFERKISANDVEFHAPPTRDDLQEQVQQLTNVVKDLQQKISELEVRNSKHANIPRFCPGSTRESASWVDSARCPDFDISVLDKIL